MNKITEAALTMLEGFEGLRTAAYQDVAGLWTIGYGHRPSYKGQTIPQATAQLLLKQDVASAANAVMLSTHDVPTTDNQFGAMVSLCYNIGSRGFAGSSVLRFHRAKKYADAARSFLLWDKAHIDGKLVVVGGLLTRRGKEMEFYSS